MLQLNKELVKELVKAFNINNMHHCIMLTNFTVQNSNGQDYVTMAFDRSMDVKQCVGYLNKLREKIIWKFIPEYRAKDSFNLDYFPFNPSQGSLDTTRNRYRYTVPITKEVLFNLKSHLVRSIAKNIYSIDMHAECWGEIYRDNKYIMHILFDNSNTANEFAERFRAEIKEYKNSPSNPLEVNGDDVYIRDIFNDPEFVKSCMQDMAWATGISSDFTSDSELRDTLIQFVYKIAKIEIDKYENSSGYGNPAKKIMLIPIVKDDNLEDRYLKKNEVNAINHAFGYEVLNDVAECTEDLAADSSELQCKGVYGIDFYNKDISDCVINTLLENSLVTKVGRDKYKRMEEEINGLVVGSSLHLSRIYFENLNSEYVRRPSPPEITVRSSNEDVMSCSYNADVEKDGEGSDYFKKNTKERRSAGSIQPSTFRLRSSDEPSTDEPSSDVEQPRAKKAALKKKEKKGLGCSIM